MLYSIEVRFIYKRSGRRHVKCLPVLTSAAVVYEAMCIFAYAKSLNNIAIYKLCYTYTVYIISYIYIYILIKTEFLCKYGFMISVLCSCKSLWV